MRERENERGREAKKKLLFFRWDGSGFTEWREVCPPLRGRACPCQRRLVQDDAGTMPAASIPARGKNAAVLHDGRAVAAAEKPLLF